MQGTGFMIYPDGSRSDGTWENDEPVGASYLTKPNGEIYKGYWGKDKIEELREYKLRL